MEDVKKDILKDSASITMGRADKTRPVKNNPGSTWMNGEILSNLKDLTRDSKSSVTWGCASLDTFPPILKLKQYIIKTW
jgi:hypothetical protein